MAKPCPSPCAGGGPSPCSEALPLGDDALHAVLSQLDWPDLLAASAASRQLRAAAASPHLWTRFCRRRWAGTLNTDLFAPGGSAHGQSSTAGLAGGAASYGTDFRRLFLTDNGWAQPRLSVQQYAGVRWADELVALHPETAADGTTTLTVSSCRELRVLRFGPDGGPPRVLRAANHSVHSGRELWSSVAPIRPAPAALGGGDGGGSVAGDGWVAAGGCHGSLALFQLPESGSASPAAEAVKPAATLSVPGNSCLVSQLHYAPAQHRLAALHDALALLRPVPQCSALSVVDAASWRLVAPAMHDVLDGYELAAVAPVGQSGGVYVAGSVRLCDVQASGWACQRCPPAAPAALCFHKSPAAAAALCMFDCRAAQAMVARYSTHHRSLHPHLEPVREHFLLTSHAGTPVAVWDHRQMNGPVHEVQHLPRDLHPSLLVEGALPLDSPDFHDRPTSQALHLSATEDLLVGRDDSGMCWLFDLSERLGWADGSNAGSWLRSAQSACGSGGAAEGQMHGQAEAATAPGGHMDEMDWERSPLPLGCVGAPYEVWCSSQGEAAPLHWLPPPLAWVSHRRLVALGGLDLEDKQQLFPAHAQGSPYPSNAVVLATLRPPGG